MNPEAQPTENLVPSETGPEIKKSRWQRFADPRLLLFILSAGLLSALWATTLKLIDAEYETARSSLITSTAELANTYETQVVRALREINQSLKTLQYSVTDDNHSSILAELQKKTLLLPDFLFTTSIADSNGDITASTRLLAQSNIADLASFRQLIENDDIVISQTTLDPISSEREITFSRRLSQTDGSFAGIVMISVEIAYFVSAYEEAQLGQQGMLGLVGTDGIFRVRRSGEQITSGESIDYTSLTHQSDDLDDFDKAPVKLINNSWDQVKRYTRATKLFEFPLVVILGIAEEEQLQDADQTKRLYLQRSTTASVILILVMSLLTRLSWQLQESRRQALAEHIAHAKNIEYLAYHDSLTGLPNRSFFSKLLSQGLSEAKRHDRKLALLFLDLDRFKAINDTLGHDAGDDLLKEIARRLTDTLRDTDIVARLGGDEFVILITEMDEEKHIADIARKILGAVAKPFTLAGRPYRITVSIGISVFSQDGEDEQTLTKHADIAMYHAKETGKNNFRFYSEQLNTASLERLALESSLRQALDRDEFRLHFQEKRNLASNKVIGAEALLRWQHPTLGLIMPLQFLPLAEETGLILPIGKWVLESACRHALSWDEDSTPSKVIAVNLTAGQFNDEHLLANISHALKKTGLNPGLLELEITESTLLTNLDKAMVTLNKIKALGVRVAVDNFGTSYSAISTLESFHFDSLKIDGSLIRNIASVPPDRDLTKAIIAVGRTMATTIVAEGVETQAQADFLRANSCDQAQGYFFDEPHPPTVS